MKRTIAFLLTFLMIFGSFSVIGLAQDGDSLNFTITANGTESRTVAINGVIALGAGKNVSVKVTNPNGETEYINQALCGSDNTFSFSYTSTDLINGDYKVSIGYEGMKETLVKTASYTKPNGGGSSVGGGGGGGVVVAPSPSTKPDSGEISDGLKKAQEGLKTGDDSKKAETINSVKDTVADAIKSLKDSDEQGRKEVIAEAQKTVSAIVEAAATLKDEAKIVEASKSIDEMIGKIADNTADLSKAETKEASKMITEAVKGKGALVENVATTEKAVEIAKSLISTTATAVDKLDNAGAEKNKIQKSLLNVVDKVVEKAGRQEVAATVDGTSAVVKADSIKVNDIIAKAESAKSVADSLNQELKAAGVEKSVESKVVLNVPTASGIKEVKAELPAGLIDKCQSMDKIEIASGLASISVSPKELNVEGASKVAVSAQYADNKLTDAQKEVAGNNPVFDFAIQVTKNDGTESKISSFNKPVEVRIPYEPKAGVDTNRVTVFYIDENGVLTNRTGKYDPDTKTVVFHTNHFSVYMVKENIVSFSDVANDYWGSKQIEVLASKGIVNGKDSSDTYKPEDNITRAEFAKLITSMLNIVTDGSSSLDFSDVSSDSWSYKYIASAVNAGIIKGYDDNTFRPDENISRQDMAVIIGRALNIKDAGANHNIAISDKSDIGDYAVNYVSELINDEVFSGYPDGSFKPNDNATRAEAATIIYNLYMR